MEHTPTAIRPRHHQAKKCCSGRHLGSAVVFLLVLYAGLLAWIGLNISPVRDEVGHLPAGVYAWQFGRFDLYRVNPPLVRMTAALPVLVAVPETDWHGYWAAPGSRPEWIIGQDLIASNQDWAFWYFSWSRWACIPFCLMGAYVCWRWARQLYGKAAGVLAMGLWCLSPNVIAWGSTICPDAPAAALGVAACYVFWRWLRGPTWHGVIVAAVALGIAELAKTTWIVLFGVWPLVWMVWRWSRWDEMNVRERRRNLGQMALIVGLSVFVINLGYGFEGSFKRLGDYRFVSRSFAGGDSLVEGGSGGNRFRESRLGSVPVPLPENYLGGIDLQKRDFEEGKWSYLRGEWKRRGWWYYYLYAATLKVPLGTWLLGVMALVLSLKGSRMTVETAGQAGHEVRNRPYSAGWLNEFVLLLPAVVVFVLVSSQTGFSRYFRYVLPCFPFAFIWISKVSRSITLREWKVVAISGMLLAWSVVSSLWHYPHSMSYFNELAGGPTRGHAHLLDANIDWGQDMHYLKRWMDKHPEARTLQMAYWSFVHPRYFGIEYELPPEGADPGVTYSAANVDLNELGPRPGWYAMSVHQIYSNTQDYRYFLEFEPVAMAGYSIYIYRITLDDANRVRRELGLPELPVERSENVSACDINSSAVGFGSGIVSRETHERA